MKKKKTILFLECSSLRPKVEIIEQLLKWWPQAARLPSSCADGTYPIHQVVSLNDTTVLRLLLSVWPEGAQAVNKHGNVPLHVAAYYTHVPAIKLLLEVFPEGKSIQNNNKQTPMDISRSRMDRRALEVFDAVP